MEEDGHRDWMQGKGQVSVLASRALQRGKLKSGNGTNGCLTPEILVVPNSSGNSDCLHPLRKT